MNSRLLTVICDQCVALSINGHATHKLGCPNSKRTWVRSENFLIPEPDVKPEASHLIPEPDVKPEAQRKREAQAEYDRQGFDNEMSDDYDY